MMRGEQDPYKLAGEVAALTGLGLMMGAHERRKLLEDLLGKRTKISNPQEKEVEQPGLTRA